MNLSLRQIRAFSTVARAGSFTAAGRQLSLTQSAVSMLVQQLEEELGVTVTEACLAPFVFASHGYESFHLMMPLYLCRRWDGVVTAKEHAALAWVKPSKLGDYPMPPADAPLVAWLRDLI